jgi:hypothetical protein
VPYADREKRLKYLREYNKNKVATARARHRADPRLDMLYNARGRARRLGLECTIKLDDIVIPAVCPILGIPLKPRRYEKGPGSASPTIDRIDRRFGYTPGNIQVISHRANRMKTDASPDELLAFAQWVQQTYSLRQAS